MKSIETKFNEALAELKKKVSAKKYEEVCQQYMPLSSIEAKLNCVEEALKGVVKESSVLNLTDIDEAKRDSSVAILFGVDAKRTTTNKEAAPIVKHNGASDNYTENNPFRPLEEFRESVDNKARLTENNANKIDKATADGLLKCKKITEAEHAQLVGKKPAGYDQLTEQQRKEFDFGRLIGISEQDCFRLAKLAGRSIKEVSR